MTVANNEFTRAAYMPVRIKGNMPHGSNYWQDNGVTEPTRELVQFLKIRTCDSQFIKQN